MARDRRPRDDEDEDDRPRRTRRPADEDEDGEAPRAKKKPRVVPDEDEEEARPRRKARAREDDEDEEERPRRRKKKNAAGMSKGLLVGLIGGGVALVGVVVLLIVLLGGGGSPKGVMAKVVRGLKSGDYGVVYDNMTTAAQQGVGRGVGGIGVSGSARERFIETMKTAEKMGFNPADKLGNVTILGETITGNTAVVRIRDGNGREDDVPFIKENGVWKLGGL